MGIARGRKKKSEATKRAESKERARKLREQEGYKAKDREYSASYRRNKSENEPSFKESQKQIIAQWKDKQNQENSNDRKNEYQKARERYQSDPDVRTAKLQDNVKFIEKKRKTEPEYIAARTRKQSEAHKEKYHSNPDLREIKLEANEEYIRHRSDSDPQFKADRKVQQAKAQKEKYHSNPDVRQKKLEGNEEYIRQRSEADPQFKADRKSQQAEAQKEKYHSTPDLREKKLEVNEEYIGRRSETDQQFVIDRAAQQAEAQKSKYHTDENTKIKKIDESAKSREKQNAEKTKKRMEKTIQREKERIIKNNKQLQFQIGKLQAIEYLLHAKTQDGKPDFTARQTARTLLKFVRKSREVPSHICTCCETLNFGNNVVEFKFDLLFENYNKIARKRKNAEIEKSKRKSYPILDKEEFKRTIVGIESDKICRTCHRNINNEGYIPDCHPLSGIRKPEYYNRPKCLTIMNDTEELFVAPVHAFYQIRPRNRHMVYAQLEAKGGVASFINFTPHISKMFTVLPRDFTDLDVFQLEFKRNLKHKTCYKRETIRVKVIFDALKHLLTTKLYKKYGIDVDWDKFNAYDPNSTGRLLNFIVPNKNEQINTDEYTATNEDDQNKVSIDSKDKKDSNAKDIEKKEEEKLAHLVFSSTLTLSNNQGQSIEYRNLSALNSIFHGFHYLFTQDENVKNFVEKYLSDGNFCDFFSFMIEMSQSKNKETSKWINFIGKAIKSGMPMFRNYMVNHITCKDLASCKIGECFLKFLNEEYSSISKQRVCEECPQNDEIIEKLSIVSIKNDSMKDFNFTLRNKIMKFANDFPKDKNNCAEACEKCQVKSKLNEMIFVHVEDSPSFKGKRSTYSNLFKNIPNYMTIDEKSFKLKFIVSEETSNYITYVKHESFFIEINDLTGTQKVIKDQKFKVNPSLFVYFNENHEMSQTDELMPIEPQVKMIESKADGNIEQISPVCQVDENIAKLPSPTDQMEVEPDFQKEFTLFPNTFKLQNKHNTEFIFNNVNLLNSILHPLKFLFQSDPNFESSALNAPNTNQKNNFFQFVSWMSHRNEYLNGELATYIVDKLLSERRADFEFMTSNLPQIINLNGSLEELLSSLMQNEYSSLSKNIVCSICKNSSNSYPFIPIRNREKNLFLSLGKEIDEFATKEDPNLKVCPNCSNEHHFNDMILVNIRSSIDIKDDDEQYSDIFKEIPCDLILNNEIYKLKFVIHHGSNNNYIPYVLDKCNFIELNDLTMEQTKFEVHNSTLKVNPTILAYFKQGNHFYNPNAQSYCLDDEFENQQVDRDHEIMLKNLEVIYHSIETVNSFEEVKGNLIALKEILDIEGSEFDFPDKAHIKEFLGNLDKLSSDAIEEQLDLVKKFLIETTDEHIDNREHPIDHVLLMGEVNCQDIEEYGKEYSRDSSKLFQDVMVLAPHQHKKPIPASQMPDYEALCWPRSYCGEPQTYDRSKISYTTVIKNDIGHHDRTRFTTQQILAKAREKIRRDLSSATSIGLRKCFAGNLTKKDVATQEQRSKLVSKNIGYNVLTDIRTSNEYLMKKELRAKRMLQQFGLCSFFITTGLAEAASAELMQQAYKNIYQIEISLEEALNLSPEIKSKLIREDPTSCVEYYRHRQLALDEFMKAKGGLFGENYVTHNLGRAETQMRGSCHCHEICWCLDAPVLIPYETDPVKRDRNMIEVVEFVDKHISTKFQKDHPFMYFQMHHHTHTCYKKDFTKCRFHFPRYVAHETQILYPLRADERTETIIEKRKSDLKKIKEKTNHYKNTQELQSFEEMLSDLKLNMNEYYDAIRLEITKVTILYKRDSDSVMVNNYNPILLDHLAANHDIQLICDAYAAIHYLFKYCLKVDEGVNFLMEKAMKECREGNLSIQETFRKIGNVFYNSSTISAQQAILEIKGYPIVYFSNDEVFINTNEPENRTCFIKSSKEIDELESPESKDICSKGLIDNYMNRPEELENLTLADLGCWYNVETAKKGKKLKKDEKNNDGEFSDGDEPHDDENIEGQEENENKIETDVDEKENLNDNKENKPKNEADNKKNITAKKFKNYKKRTRERVIRFVNYKLEHDPINYYREMVMLYYPWRNEETELLNPAIVRETFEKNQEQIMQKYREYNIITEAQLEKLKEAVMRNLETEFAEEIEQFLNDDMTHENHVDVLDELGLLDGEEKKTRGKKPKESKKGDSIYALKVSSDINVDELYENLRKANEEQQDFIHHVYHYIKTVNLFEDKGKNIILQGKAGVGKTFVINILKDLLNLHYNKQAGDKFLGNHVLLCAPTGIAAALIEGLTIHKALQINTKYSATIRKLGADLANALRRELHDIKIMIADEYSMISRELRANMDRRARELFSAPDQSFGGKMMIFCGDLFQLPPVRAIPIYMRKQKGAKPDDFIYDDVWRSFEMFELTKGVRQRHQAFLSFLDDYGQAILTPEGEKLIRDRIFDDESKIPAEAIWVFHLNSDVDKHNEKVINAMDGQLFESIAEDTINIMEHSKNKDKQRDKASHDTLHASLSHQYATKIFEPTKMRYRVPLKAKIRYKLTNNIDVSDGLAKSSLFKLMRIDCDKKTNKPAILWGKFRTSKIGSKARQLNIEYMKANNIPLDWVPIKKYSDDITFNAYVTNTWDKSMDKKLELDERIAHVTMRKQFPVTPCEACTIHSVQGLTLSCVCLDARKGGLSTAMAYVVMTRCDYDNLYILGDSFLPPKKISQDLLNEVYRLRHAAKLNLSFYNFEQDCGIKIVYHNVNSYKKHKDDVTAMNWYWKADIIILAESNVQSSEEVNVRNGFKVVYPSGQVQQVKQKKSEGLVIISRNNFNIRDLSKPNVIRNQSNHQIDLRSFLIGHNLIITGYRHPNANMQDFIDEIYRLLKNLPDNCDVTILGDFNIDMNNAMTKKNAFYKFLVKNEFVNYLGESKTRDSGTQIDVVFSTSTKGYGGTLASYFSDHYAIFFQTEIDPKKLQRKDQKYLASLKGYIADLEKKRSEISYNVIDADDIKSGKNGNNPFKNEIHALINIDGTPTQVKFLEMSCFNAVFSALNALYQYTEVFQSAVEGLTKNYKIFEFILEISENFHNLSYDKDQRWIDFMSINYPNVIELKDYEIQSKIKIMSDSITLAFEKLLTNWSERLKEIENSWVSWERQLVVQKESTCHQIIMGEQGTVINLNITKNDLIENFSQTLESAIMKPVNCSTCNETISCESSYRFSDFAVIISLKLSDAIKINIIEIPKIITLKGSSYVFKIVISRERTHYKTLYRVRDNNFLEIDCKPQLQNFELFIKQHSLEVNSDIIVVYVKSHEEITENEFSSQFIENNLSQKTSDMSIFDDSINEMDSDDDVLMKAVDEINNYDICDIQAIEEKASHDSLIGSDVKLSFNSRILFDGVTYQNQNISSDGYYGDIVFQNTFIIPYNNENINFINLCPFNAVFSAFHSLYNFSSFKKTISRLSSDFEFFDFLVEINRSFINKSIKYQSGIYRIGCNENNQKLIAFIEKMFPGRIEITRERNDKDGNLIEILKPPECTLALECNNVIEQYEGEIGFFRNWQNIPSRNIFTTRIESFKCLHCNDYSVPNERFTLMKTNVSMNDLENFDQSFLEEDIVVCSKCGQNAHGNANVNFPDKCLILDISLLRDIVPTEVRVKLNKIATKIVVNEKKYVLKVVIDRPGFHFNSYHRFNNGNFLLMNDTHTPFGEEILVTEPSQISVNPVILIYLREDEDSGEDLETINLSSDDELEVIENYYSGDEQQNLNKIPNPKKFARISCTENLLMPLHSEKSFPMLTNTIGVRPSIIKRRHSNETFYYLCPFNSIFHGFAKSFENDELFRKFIHDNANDFKFFNKIVEIMNSNKNEIGQIWIQFLSEVLPKSKDQNDQLPFKETSNCNYSMIYTINSAIEHFFEKSFKSYELIKGCRCNNKDVVNSYSCIEFVCEQNENLIFDILSNFNQKMHSTSARARICQNCNTNKVIKRIEYSDIIFIYFFLPTVKEVKIPLSKIPIILNTEENETYKLKFLIHWENNKIDNGSVANHFYCYAYDYNKIQYTCIDDLLTNAEHVKIGEKEKYVCPQILCFFKDKTIESNIQIARTVTICNDKNESSRKLPLNPKKIRSNGIYGDVMFKNSFK